MSNLIRAEDFTITWDADGRHYLMCPGKTDQMHNEGQP
jgi:hypothetical protein